MEAPDLVIAPQVGVDGAQCLQGIKTPRQRVPATSEVVREEVLVGEEIGRDERRRCEHVDDVLEDVEGWVEHHEPAVKQAIRTGAAVRDLGRVCIGVFHGSVRAIGGDPEAGGVSLQGLCCRCSRDIPVLGVMGELARVACTGVCGRNPVFLEFKVQKLVHVAHHYHVRIQENDPLDTATSG